MPVTTFLHDGELNQKCSSPELQQLLDDVRKLDGRDWQIVEQFHYDKRLFSPDRTWITRTLYLYVGGVGPWQKICSESTFPDAGTIKMFLLGALAILDNATLATVDKT